MNLFDRNVGVDMVLHEHGHHAAVIMGRNGEQVSFTELDNRSTRLAQLLAAQGLSSGDHIAILMPNEPRYFEVAWAAQRSGLFYTPVNWHLTAGEAAYVVTDCEARALIASAELADMARCVLMAAPNVEIALMVGGETDGFENYERGVSAQRTEPLGEQTEGRPMFYSSGTTGRPKGIESTLSGEPFGTGGPLDGLLTSAYGFSADTIYLSTGPLYHAAPLAWSMAAQRQGGTAVVMERFDPVEMLQLIEQHQITHVQVVPTMFVRMLKLPEHQRRSFDLSSLRVVVHAAAPCPVEIKEEIIEWLGPIVHEYYAGSEGNGFCAIDTPAWLTHKGSVGKPLLGTPHILNEHGDELRTGEIGTVWFAGGVQFSYHNDKEKTESAYNDRGWSTLGDMGYLDEEGFLYLTDRRTDLIISGGVNIYPQEVEDVLILHPAVADVAVLGTPHDEMGQQVTAVIQLVVSARGDDRIAEELVSYCRDKLAHFKCPKSVDFVDEMPRLASGKLLKRVLRERYPLAPSSPSQ